MSNQSRPHDFVAVPLVFVQRYVAAKEARFELFKKKYLSADEIHNANTAYLEAAVALAEQALE